MVQGIGDEERAARVIGRLGMFRGEYGITSFPSLCRGTSIELTWSFTR